MLREQEMLPLPAWAFWTGVNAQHFDYELLENRDCKQPWEFNDSTSIVDKIPNNVASFKR